MASYVERCDELIRYYDSLMAGEIAEAEKLRKKAEEELERAKTALLQRNSAARVFFEDAKQAFGGLLREVNSISEEDRKELADEENVVRFGERAGPIKSVEHMKEELGRVYGIELSNSKHASEVIENAVFLINKAEELANEGKIPEAEKEIAFIESLSKKIGKLAEEQRKLDGYKHRLEQQIEKWENLEEKGILQLHTVLLQVVQVLLYLAHRIGYGSEASQIILKEVAVADELAKTSRIITQAEFLVGLRDKVIELLIRKTNNNRDVVEVYEKIKEIITTGLKRSGPVVELLYGR